MQTGKSFDHGSVDLSAITRRANLRESRVLDKPAVNKVVTEERGSQHGYILAEEKRVRDGNLCLSQGLHRSELPVHRMGAPKKLPRRLLAKNQLPARGGEQVGGVGLSVGELPQLEALLGEQQSPGEEVGRESSAVDAEAGTDIAQRGVGEPAAGGWHSQQPPQHGPAIEQERLGQLDYFNELPPPEEPPSELDPP